MTRQPLYSGWEWINNGENDRLMMPVSVRMNHAVADGYLVANVFRLLEKEMDAFCSEK